MSFLFKTISELKLAEIKSELDRRGIDNLGVKTTLIHRLEQVGYLLLVGSQKHELSIVQKLAI